jgi:PhnB protein
MLLVLGRSAAANANTTLMPSPTPFEFIPYLSITDAAKAVEFYTKVFGVDPYVQINMGGVMHCEFRVANARFFLSEELPEHGGTPSPTRLAATTVAIHLYVDDCDAMVETMKDHVATVLMEPGDVSVTHSATNGAPR